MAASYPVPDQTTGHLVTAVDWNLIADDVNDLNTRETADAAAIANGTTGNAALGTRMTAVETTVNATGTTAAGNAALSSRLGTGVTTASTATAQLATLTTNVATGVTNTSTNTAAIATINTNLGTWSGGTAISRIGSLETTVNAAGTTAAGNAALSTRIGSGITTAAPADTRLATVEATTTNTSGTVGIGNQRLSDRLGATITNASTAAAQIGTLTTGLATVNTNLGTWSGGTAISRITTLEGTAGTGTAQATVRESTTATALTGGTGLDVPFPVSVSSDASVTYSAPVFTIATAGYYLIETSIRVVLAGTVEVNIWINRAGGGYRRKAGNVGTTISSCQRGIRLAVGDLIKVTALCSSSTTIETGAEDINHVSITRLAA
jgi:hypothetical protein